MLNAWQDYKLSRKDLAKLADVVHNVRDVGRLDLQRLLHHRTAW